MQLIQHASATADHRFTEGDAVRGLLPTRVTSEWLNAVQSEIVGTIADAGMTPDATVQLPSAVRSLVTTMVNPDLDAMTMTLLTMAQTCVTILQRQVEMAVTLTALTASTTETATA